MTLYFSVPVAILLTLLAAGLWGSWMQVIKHLNQFPMSGLVFWLYLFSFVLVWSATLLLAPVLLPDGIASIVGEKIELIGEIILGGGMMSLGMYISLVIMNRIGLLLSVAISGAVSSVLGIVTSIAKEGLPNTPFALPLIISSTTVFFLASIICNRAATMRDRDIALLHRSTKSEQLTEKISLNIVLLTLLCALLGNGWSIGTATGTAANFPPILTCAFMVTGSFASILILCTIIFTVKKQWKTVLCVSQSKRPIVLGAVSALCHYGGNLISIYSMPVVSATLSFLFGRTANAWTYFWGLFYGEFKGSGHNTKIVLTVGIALYFVGVALLGLFNFS